MEGFLYMSKLLRNRIFGCVLKVVFISLIIQLICSQHYSRHSTKNEDSKCLFPNLCSTLKSLAISAQQMPISERNGEGRGHIVMCRGDVGAVSHHASTQVTRCGDKAIAPPGLGGDFSMAMRKVHFSSSVSFQGLSKAGSNNPGDHIPYRVWG